MEGNEKQKEWGKQRAIYNSMNSTSIPYGYKMTNEEKEKTKKDFEFLYGFNPENSMK